MSLAKMEGGSEYLVHTLWPISSKIYIHIYANKQREETNKAPEPESFILVLVWWLLAIFSFLARALYLFPLFVYLHIYVYIFFFDAILFM